MTSQEVRARIEETGIVTAVRVYSAEEALFAAEAVVAGGICVVEITLTVPQATEVVSQLVRSDWQFGPAILELCEIWPGALGGACGQKNSGSSSLMKSEKGEAYPD